MATRPTESEFPDYKIEQEAQPALPVETEEPPEQIATVQVRDDGPELTLEDLYLSATFASNRFLSGRWAEQGPILYFLNSEDGRIIDLVALDLQEGMAEKVIDGSDLHASDVDRLVSIEDYALTSNDSLALVFTDTERMWRTNTLGYYYLFDRKAREVRPISEREKGLQMFAKLSPDGRHIGFVRNRDLYFLDIENRAEVRVTSSGSPGAVINGTYDWVYEEEFFQRDGWSWSPDGSKMAFVQLDESAVPEFSMVDQRDHYPSLTQFKYPKAGDPNSEIRIGVYDLDSEATKFLEAGTWFAGADSLEYLVGLGWTPEIDGRHYVWTIRINRFQNTCQLLFGDPDNATVRVVMEESEPTWVEVDAGSSLAGLQAGKIRFLEDGQHFVWLSEVSGYSHLDLYSLDGNFVRHITSGDWDVAGVHGLVGDDLVITAALGDPTQRHAYRVSLDGGLPQRMTEGQGWHSIDLSSDGEYFLDTYSTIDQPPTVSLFASSGELVRVLEDNQRLRGILEAYNLPETELTTVPAADGTELNAYLIKPTYFEEENEYPLLIHTYGGPGSQEVRQSWGGVERLWHKMLAEEMGVVIAGVDNRGTGGRGKSFKSATYKQLGVLEAADQQSAARHLAALPYIDQSRVAIWGWSYGGFLTLLAMLTDDGPELFSAGMAVAPVTHWGLYDTIYTERFMTTPANNPEGYEIGSPITYADRLSDDQDLLIVHGDQDDNVHFQNTIQMTEALQNAGKRFDVMIYPGKTHSIAGGRTRYHLFRMMTEFLSSSFGLQIPTTD